MRPIAAALSGSMMVSAAPVIWLRVQPIRNNPVMTSRIAVTACPTEDRSEITDSRSNGT